MKTPFTSVTFFEVADKQDLPKGIDYEQLQDFLDGFLHTGKDVKGTIVEFRCPAYVAG
jgi:hypothetical protein